MNKHCPLPRYLVQELVINKTTQRNYPAKTSAGDAAAAGLSFAQNLLVEAGLAHLAQLGALNGAVIIGGAGGGGGGNLIDDEDMDDEDMDEFNNFGGGAPGTVSDPANDPVNAAAGGGAASAPTAAQVKDYGAFVPAKMREHGPVWKPSVRWGAGLSLSSFMAVLEEGRKKWGEKIEFHNHSTDSITHSSE